MKSKVIKKLLTIALIIAISIPVISHAVNLEAEKLFLSCDKQDVSPGETVILTLDLGVIQYEDFEFLLTSNTDIENITTDQENIEITNNSEGFKIIANKTDLNIEKIDFSYVVDIEDVGTKIEFKGILKENNKEATEESEKQEITITITVVEEKESIKNEDNNQNEEENKKQEPSMEKEQSTISNKTTNMQMNQMQSNSNKMASGSALGVQETNIYKGESNNYLSTLEITNCNINPTFRKTNTTYFVEVGSDVSEIDINAQAEDENATINIYGNDNLKNGENKVLISVTAENGEVKTYRIYVNKK